MKGPTILVVIVVLAAGNALAFRGGHGMRPGMVMDPSMVSLLDLSEDQKVQIQAKQEAHEAEINPLHDKLFSRKMELRILWAQPTPDQAKIVTKQREIQALQNQIQEMAIRFKLECRQLLTPEQREKLGTSAAYDGGWSSPGGKIRRW